MLILRFALNETPYILLFSATQDILFLLSFIFPTVAPHSVGFLNMVVPFYFSLFLTRLLLPSRLHWASRKAPRRVISELLLVLGMVAFLFSFASPDDDSTQLEVAETASVQTAFAPAASGPSLIVLTGPSLTSRSPFPVPACNSTRVTSMEDFGSCRTSAPRPFGLRSPPPTDS